jgi:hypothetical protein
VGGRLWDYLGEEGVVAHWAIVVSRVSPEREEMGEGGCRQLRERGVSDSVALDNYENYRGLGKAWSRSLETRCKSGGRSRSTQLRILRALGVAVYS